MVAFFISRYNALFAFLRSAPCLHDRWTLKSEVHQFHVVIFLLSVLEAVAIALPDGRWNHVHLLGYTCIYMYIWSLRVLRSVLCICTCICYNIREVEG